MGDARGILIDLSDFTMNRLVPGALILFVVFVVLRWLGTRRKV